MIKLFLCALLTILCQSCISININGSFRGLYSYYKKTKEENPTLLIRPEANSSVCTLTNSSSPNVYMINGKSLKECISQEQDAIVYIWDINCGSKYCYTPEIVQIACEDKNISLYIVAEYYDSEPMMINYNTEKPIFGIDTEYYKSNLTHKYLSKFIDDLTGQKETTYGFFHFKDGNFVKRFKSVNYIDTI